MVTKQSNIVGVAVGRFQVHSLHRGHRHLIDEMFERHDDVLILIGTGNSRPTDHDPLSYAQRRILLSEAYPKLKINEICDHPSDDIWSHNLDDVIAEVYGKKKVILYGSRDSFSPYYSGKHKVCLIKEVPDVSGTMHRKKVSKKIAHAESFRRGVIHAVADMHPPTAYTMVNIAVLRESQTEVLLYQKNGEEMWRFPGRFMTPNDISFESVVQHIVSEEMGNITIDKITYVGSHRIDEKIFRNAQDSVLSVFFDASLIPDVIQEVQDDNRMRWLDICDLERYLHDDHQQLRIDLMENIA